jgi:hypothetical protein
MDSESAEGRDHPKLLQQTQPICVFPLLHNLVAVEPVDGAPGLAHLLAYRRKPRDRSIPRTLTALRPEAMRASTTAQLARDWFCGRAFLDDLVCLPTATGRLSPTDGNSSYRSFSTRGK